MILLVIITGLFPFSLGLSTPPDKSAKAVYFLDNKSPNSIVALAVGPDGLLLSGGSITGTGGMGSSFVQAGSSLPSLPDALSSSSSILVSDDVLFAVNPGSDSLSMFRINPKQPTDITLIGKPISTQGDFPTSIAYSAPLNQVCVSNTGTRSGIVCFHVSFQDGLKVSSSSTRSLPLNQTTPPSDFPAASLDAFVPRALTSISFNSDSSALIATIAGNPLIPLDGYLAIYAVHGSDISLAPTIGTPNGTFVLYSSLNIPNTRRILATDAFFGVAIIDISRSYVGSSVYLITIPSKKAPCWAALSPYTKTAFVTDGLTDQFAEIDPETGTLIDLFNGTSGNIGNLDIAAAGDKLYALSPGSSGSKTAVTVLDVSQGRGRARVIQNFRPSGLGVDFQAQGMAIYI